MFQKMKNKQIKKVNNSTYFSVQTDCPVQTKSHWTENHLLKKSGLQEFAYFLKKIGVTVP